jgi:DNA-directed RNA polymerase specialized sigma24 family protein
MASQSRTHKNATRAMSPLLRALTFSRAAHEPVTQAMLLQAYASLDRFRRGYGSHELLENLS